MKNLSSKSNPEVIKTKPVKTTNPVSSPVKNLKTSIKRNAKENPSEKRKKQKIHPEFSVLTADPHHLYKNQVKVSFSFPEQGLQFNRKEVLQQILKHCDNVRNPGYILCKFEDKESTNKAYTYLKNINVGNRKLYLERTKLPTENSVDRVKKVLLLPKKHASKLNDIKVYYNAISVEKIVELENQNLYFLLFKSKTEAEAAVKKEGYSVEGHVVTLKNCESETQTNSEEASGKSQNEKINNVKEKININDDSGEEEEEGTDDGEEEETDDDEEGEGNAEEADDDDEGDDDDDDDEGDDDDDDDDDDNE